MARVGIYEVISFTTLFVLSIQTSNHTRAAETVWYDAEKQAIAFDPYHDGWGGRMQFDFNSDHAWAAVVTQNLYHYLFGLVTEQGQYKETIYTFPNGGIGYLTQYGWGTRLGSLTPVYNHSTKVTTVYGQSNVVDQHYYFTDYWNVAQNKTTLYIQPLVNGEPSPVAFDDLANFYYRICQVGNCAGEEWHSLDSAPPIVVDATLSVQPETINLKSKGQYISVKVEFPEEYSTEEIVPESVSLVVGGESEYGSAYEVVGKKQASDQNNNGKLDFTVKFDRQYLNMSLSVGETGLIVYGSLVNGERFQASATVAVINPGNEKHN